jgi:hypothetical protein
LEKFNTKVESAKWDEENGVWRLDLTAADGTHFEDICEIPVNGSGVCWNYSRRGRTGWLPIGFILRVLFTGSLVRPYYSGYLLGATVLIILSIYMGPVDPQVDYQAIQSILCCAYITTIIVISLGF